MGIVSIVFFSGFLFSQSLQPNTNSKVTTAVIDFDGLGITTMEAITLTQRLAGEMVNTNKLIPWFRLSNVSTNVDIDSKIKDYKRFGITWWPIDNVAFKFDYGTITKKSDKDNPVTQINLGLGYNF